MNFIRDMYPRRPPGTQDTTIKGRTFYDHSYEIDPTTGGAQIPDDVPISKLAQHAREPDIQNFCGDCDYWRDGRCQRGYGDRVTEISDLVFLALLAEGNANREFMRELMNARNGETDQNRYVVRGHCKSQTIKGVSTPQLFVETNIPQTDSNGASDPPPTEE